jgi:tRNA dimethylallyltransferase
MEPQEKISVLAVVGPTASGKTALGVALAKALGGEIVSADSMQIYKDMSIATAQPSKAEKENIPHHLIGFLSPAQEYSVANFVADAACAIKEIQSRGRLPILVGGTGLYISSLLDSIAFENAPKADSTRRERLRALAREEGNEAVHQILSELDPAGARTLHPNNLGRVIRAIELVQSTNKSLRQLREESRVAGVYNPVMLGLTFSDRALLYRRIDFRVDEMLKNGLVEETRRFYGNYGGATAAQAIGYKELKPYLDEQASLGACAERLKMQTRRYAKRQLTWFRRDERVVWLYRDSYPDFGSLVCEALRTAEESGISARREAN